MIMAPDLEQLSCNKTFGLMSVFLSVQHLHNAADAKTGY